MAIVSSSLSIAIIRNLSYDIRLRPRGIDDDSKRSKILKNRGIRLIVNIEEAAVELSCLPARQCHTHEVSALPASRLGQGSYSDELD